MSAHASFVVLSVLLGAVASAACVLINKFDTLVPLVDGQEVAFTLPTRDLSENAKIVLYDIGVERVSCKQDCSMWEMVRRPSKNQRDPREDVVALPVKYGVTLSGMETRVLKKLRKGDYSAGATLEVLEKGGVTVKKAVATFSID